MVGHTYKNTYTACTAIVDQKCPICGKNFVPAPYHHWKIKKKKSKGVKWENVCSYSCMRVWEKEVEKEEAKKEEEKKKKKESKNE